MRNFWTVLFVIIAIIIALQILKVLFSVGFALLKIAIPIALVGFAVYGFLEFAKKKR